MKLSSLCLVLSVVWPLSQCKSVGSQTLSDESTTEKKERHYLPDLRERGIGINPNFSDLGEFYELAMNHFLDVLEEGDVRFPMTQNDRPSVDLVLGKGQRGKDKEIVICQHSYYDVEVKAFPATIKLLAIDYYDLKSQRYFDEEQFKEKLRAQIKILETCKVNLEHVPVAFTQAFLTSFTDEYEDKNIRDLEILYHQTRKGQGIDFVRFVGKSAVQNTGGKEVKRELRGTKAANYKSPDVEISNYENAFL